MPIEYVIDPTGPFVHFVCSGEVNDADMLDFVKKFTAEVFEPLPELFDFSGITKYGLTPDGIKRLVSLETEFAAAVGPVPMAVVADSDMTYGMARMYQILSESNSNTIEIFRNVSEAKTWLYAKIAESDEGEAKEATGQS